MTIDGANNEVTASAGCPLINIVGANNILNLGVVNKIRITGSNNSVKWRGPANFKAPSVVNTGANNEIVKIGIASAPPRRTTTSRQQSKQHPSIATTPGPASLKIDKNHVKVQATSPAGNASVVSGPTGININSADRTAIDIH
jgi:hypothetical protein